MPEQRDVAVDALRTSVTLLVVWHHSILAYAAFGSFDRVHYLWSTAPVVDERRWAVFDALIVFNDGWFMAAMFAIAGLFVMPGLTRYGALRYVWRRVLRLGAPFALAAFVLMPLAYYPSYKLTGAQDGFWTFWSRTVTTGPWSAGPAWFLWVLLVFDATAAMLVAAIGQPLDGSPRRIVIGATMVALTGTVALLPAFGPDFWFNEGPFSLQASRIVLYGASFATGVLIGPRLPAIRVKARPLLCLLLFAGIAALDLARPQAPVYLWRGGFAVISVAFCVVAGMSMLALARRLPTPIVRGLQRVGPDAFWIYVVHYLPMVWLQYELLGLAIPAAVKGSTVFLLTLASSWAVAYGIRLASTRLRPQSIPSTSIIS